MLKILEDCLNERVAEVTASNPNDFLMFLYIQIILFQAAHVLIDRTGRAKLSGLRYSCSLYDSVVEASCSASVGCMTQDRYDYPLYVSLKHLNWMSPEILQQVYI